MPRTKAKEAPELFAPEPGTATATKAAPVKAATKNEVATVERLPPPTSTANILAIVSNAASDPACQPDKMRALLDMYNEVRAEESRRLFTEAKIALSRVTPEINKDGKIVIEAKLGTRNKRQETPYASFENIMKVMQPVLLDNGFDLWFAPDVGEGNRLILRGHLDHIKGHSKTCSIPMPLENSGSKNDAQGIGSSITYAKRYAAIALLNIVSHAKQDRDVDGNDPKGADAEPQAIITKKQFDELTAAIKDCDVPIETVCGKYEVEKIEDLPASMFAGAMAACAKFKANKKATG